MAFADLFDDSSAIRDQIEQVLDQPALMNLLTDSKSSFDIISKGSHASQEENYFRYLCRRQAYNSKEIP